MLVVLGLLMPVGHGGPAGVAASETDPSESTGDALREIKRRLDGAAESIMTGDDDVSAVLMDLAEAEALVELVLDPSTGPLLDPPDAGAIEEGVDPTTLQEHAMSCCVLALEAVVAEMTDPGGNDEVLGTKLKTIRYLLPQYEQLVQEMD